MIRKLDLSAVTTVCAPLGALIAQNRQVSGQSLAEPVSIDELERLRLPSTTSKETPMWRDRLVSNLRKATGASLTASQTALGSTLTAVVAAVHGMREAQAVSEGSVAPRIDYTKPPSLDFEIDLEDVHEIYPCGDGLVVTTYSSQRSYLLDMTTQTLTGLDQAGATSTLPMAVLRDGTLVVRHDLTQLKLMTNGEVKRTCDLPGSVMSVRPLRSGGFVVRTYDHDVLSFDREGNERGRWHESTSASAIKPLSDDRLAVVDTSSTRIDLVDATNGQVVGSWPPPNANLRLGRWEVLSDDKLLVTAVDRQSKQTMTYSVSVDSVVASHEKMNHFTACALQGGYLASIDEQTGAAQDLLVRDSLGRVVNTLSFGEAGYGSGRTPSLLALPDGRLVLANRFAKKITIYRFPDEVRTR